MHILKKYLDEHRHTYGSFGSMLKVSSQAVHMWITGMNTPTRKNALKIEKCTNGAVPISTWGYFMTESGRMYKIDKTDGKDEI